MKPNTFDPLKPFASDECFNDFLNVFLNMNFKLYGKLQFNVVFKSFLEFDLNAGEVHYTEKDLKAISVAFEALNKKWRTEITFCLFPSKKFPLNILINIRSPKAPFAMSA